jgi:hypothetical protein
MIGSMFSAVSTPVPTPSSVPNTPITTPCTMKMPMIERGVAPSVRRIAMSDCLSCTAMTRPEAMLNTATITISDRMMNITVFSMPIARKKLACWRVQSDT